MQLEFMSVEIQGNLCLNALQIEPAYEYKKQ